MILSTGPMSGPGELLKAKKKSISYQPVLKSVDQNVLNSDINNNNSSNQALPVIKDYFNKPIL